MPGLRPPEMSDPTSVIAGQRFRSQETSSHPWSARDHHLLALLTGAVMRGQRAIELDDRDFSALEV